MNRLNVSEKERIRLDKLNNDRINTSCKRVAKAIRMVNMPIQCYIEGHGSDVDLILALSKANNLLESAEQDIKWACEYWSWDYAVCDQIEDAIGYFGMALAILLMDETDDEEFDTDDVNIYTKQGFNLLGMVVASLTRWFDEA